jgi:hypothetical protein
MKPDSIAGVSRSSAVSAMAGLRLGVGLGAWLFPRLAGRLFGLDVEGNPQLPYVARLFGVRDIVLGAGTYVSDGEAQNAWLRAGVACDAADFAAGLLSHRNGEIGPGTAVLVSAPALAAVAMGLTALRDNAPGV